MLAILRMGPLMSPPMEVEEVNRCCRIRVPVAMDYEGPRRMETESIERVAVFRRHDKYAADANGLIPIFDYVG